MAFRKRKKKRAFQQTIYWEIPDARSYFSITISTAVVLTLLVSISHHYKQKSSRGVTPTIFFFPLTYARNPVQNCPHIAVDGKIPRNMPARYHYRSLESYCVLSTILWGKLLHPKLCVEIIHPQTNYCANDKNTAWREGLCLYPLQPSCKCLEHKETAILTGSIHIRPSPLFYRHISNSVISKNKD